jgi:single-stranded-DNA-specific exonuclease
LSEILEKPFLEISARLGPFGEGNPEPLWGLRGVQILGPPKVVGQAHLKLRVGQGAQACDAIGFNMADRLADFPEGPLDLACLLRTNTYLGRTSPQLHLQDFRESAAATG